MSSSINNFILKTYSILQEKQFESIVSWADYSEVVGSTSGNGNKWGCEEVDEQKRQQLVCSFRIHNLRAF